MGDGRHRLSQGRQQLGGVKRQYSGTLGKTANRQLGGSVNAVTEHASGPLDWRLFVPESSDEATMAARRTACHLPEQVHHRPKWQLLDQLQVLLACWAGVCPLCHRPAPRWLRRTGRSHAPT